MGESGDALSRGADEALTRGAPARAPAPAPASARAEPIDINRPYSTRTYRDGKWHDNTEPDPYWKGRTRQSDLFDDHEQQMFFGLAGTTVNRETIHIAAKYEIPRLIQHAHHELLYPGKERHSRYLRRSFLPHIIKALEDEGYTVTPPPRRKRPDATP